jgi:hypothetical protein
VIQALRKIKAAPAYTLWSTSRVSSISELNIVGSESRKSMLHKKFLERSAKCCEPNFPMNINGGTLSMCYPTQSRSEFGKSDEGAEFAQTLRLREHRYGVAVGGDDGRHKLS